MKKLLTFLTLLVLGFALPNKASAWDYSAGTDPERIVLYFNNNVSGEHEMTFSDGIWSYEFTSTLDNVSFTVRSYWSSTSYEEYYSNVGTGTVGTWVNVANNPKEKDTAFYHNGLTSGITYRIEITSGTGTDAFKFRFVESSGTETSQKLYLYNTTPMQIGEATADDNGKFTYTVKLAKGEHIILSTVANTSNWNLINSSRYNCNGDQEITNTNSIRFSQSTVGSWYAGVGGQYTITVDWDNQTLSSTVVEPENLVTFMPLSPKDFEGGKKHYFIVGNRMGEWRLLPEWELKADASGDMVLNNRWIYPGGFAIGVVDNYADYIIHKYTYYSRRWEFKDAVLVCNEDFSGTGASMTATGTVQSPSNNFWTAFSEDLGGGDYWQAIGTFVTEIRVTLKNGLPSTLAFELGSKEKAKENRFFTLVGSNIYNADFCNGYRNAETIMKSKGFSSDKGWQESWIQYDTISRKPYVDGNGNYLYHTSYTPDYLKANPVLFNTQLPNGRELSYTSNEVQFVESSKLKNLDSDPYKNFYEAFSGNERIQTGDTQKNDIDYNFIVQTDNGDVTPQKGTWSCYVVRDMWLSGEFKIWTGWGGNDDTTNSGKNNIATWHGENGGPEYDGKQVYGFDINSGQNVTLYNNNKNAERIDYKISDGKPVYFNRVILWYNIDEGIGNSFVQFIQESVGPAILAQVVKNPYTEKNNAITYNWFLNASVEPNDTREVESYTITRYKINSSGEKQFDGHPENNGTVNIEDKHLTISKFLEGNTLDFTTQVDYGDYNQGHDPGMYQYDIVVKLSDGTEKTAVSNIVTIYDGVLVSPQASAYQLVRLTAEGKTALGLAGDSSQGYMIYDPNENPQYFVLDVDANGVPSKGSYIAPAMANDFLLNNQDKYEWTSQFYVQCLDKDYYEKVFSSAGYAEIPTPTITVKAVETGVDNIDDAKVLEEVTASVFTLGENTYYSAILNRGGDLSNGSAKVTLSYAYTNANNDPVSENPTALTSLYPVAPRPYNAEYYFTLETSTQTVSADYAKLERTPVSAMGTNAPFKIVKSESDIYSSYLYTANGGGKLDTHVMVLNVEYNSPNVDADILKKYEVGQTVAVEDTNNTTLAQSDRTVNYVDATDKAKVQYLTFKGMAPFNDVIPVVKYSNTVYQVREGYTGKEGEKVADVKASFGQDIQFNALHTFESGNNSLSKPHYGNILRDGNTMDIMYKGHENFEDSDPVLYSGNASIEGDNVKKDVDAPSMPFNYYVVELGNTQRNDYSVYDYIWSHPECNHREGDVTVDPTTGFILNDTDPMIGAYVAKGFTADELQNITTYFAQIFLFSNTNVNSFNGIRIVDEVEAEASATVMASISDMVNGGVGEMPDDGTEPAKYATYESSTRWVMLGSYIKSETNVPTGVEDVLAGENGEAVYYNLQGIRVDNPSAAGVYIRVQGKQIDKVVVK